jgi:hypothetical protein
MEIGGITLNYTGKLERGEQGQPSRAGPACVSVRSRDFHALANFATRPIQKPYQLTEVCRATIAMQQRVISACASMFFVAA